MKLKFLEPTVTCVLMSHMKPYLRESLEAFAKQTRLHDVQLIVVDSGAWLDKNDERSEKMRKIYYDYVNHPNIDWYFTGESKDHAKTHCAVSYWTNRIIEGGYIKGKYFCTYYDDDIYYPDFMEKMAGYLDEHLDAQAVRCSQNRSEVQADGSSIVRVRFIADKPVIGEAYDCQVDGGQVMIRTCVLERMPKPYMNETMDHCAHSDGLFLNKVGAIIKEMPGIKEVLYEHRSTPISTYTPVRT